VCGRLIERLRASDVQVSGLATRHTGEHELMVTELASGAEYPLTLPFEPSGAPGSTRFRMDPAAFERSSQALAASFPTQVVILDEIGPLELVHRQGWVGALELLQDETFAMAFVVIRPELLSEAVEAFGADLTMVARVTEQNRDGLVETLATMAHEACKEQRADGLARAEARSGE